jgi:hypothetical protein
VAANVGADSRPLLLEVLRALVPNWFNGDDKVEGMTFGYHIWFDHTDYQISRGGLTLVLARARAR